MRTFVDSSNVPPIPGPSCSCVSRWENIEEGEFRIVDSSMVAGLWAMVKGNTKMNYEKLSRAIRLVHITVSACLLTTMFESHSMSNLFTL